MSVFSPSPSNFSGTDAPLDGNTTSITSDDGDNQQEKYILIGIFAVAFLVIVVAVVVVLICRARNTAKYRKKASRFQVHAQPSSADRRVSIPSLPHSLAEEAEKGEQSPNGRLPVPGPGRPEFQMNLRSDQLAGDPPPSSTSGTATGGSTGSSQASSSWIGPPPPPAGKRAFSPPFLPLPVVHRASCSTDIETLSTADPFPRRADSATSDDASFQWSRSAPADTNSFRQVRGTGSSGGSASLSLPLGSNNPFLTEHDRQLIELIRAGSFVRMKLLGSNPSAGTTVYSCLVDNGSAVAVKELLLSPVVDLPASFSDSGDRERGIISVYDQIVEDITTLQETTHENILGYLACELLRNPAGEYKAAVFMELVTGGSLSDMVRGMKTYLPEQSGIRYVRQIVDALHSLHCRGVIHGALKCENVLLSSEGDVKLSDIGVLAFFSQKNRAEVEYYHPPEMLAIEAKYKETKSDPKLRAVAKDPYSNFSTKADIWCLGIAVCEIFNRGQPPFGRTSVSQQKFIAYVTEHGPIVPSHVSPKCAEFIKACCCIAPGGRPSTAMLKAHPWLKEGSEAGDSLEDAKTDELCTSYGPVYPELPSQS